MDMPDFTSGRSPRRELQGPRPTPLKVRKDSHKIRKPPVAPPQQAGQHPHAPPPPPPPQPVIIYTVSPKIIHANPNEFMSLVQRLTGPNSSPSTSYSSSFQETTVFGAGAGGSISPAARFASIEKTKSPRKTHDHQEIMDIETGNYHHHHVVERTSCQFPGILSPNPNALPPIPPNFFSPPSDNINNPLSFFPDLSPVLHSNRNYLDNNFIFTSPSTFMSPHINTPSPNTLDLFHTLFDF